MAGGDVAAPAATVVAGGGPEDPVTDAAAAGEYLHSEHKNQGGSGGQGDSGAGSKGALLAIAIVLLWLAGFCFFIAFEGSKLLGADADTTGPGLIKAMLGGLASRVQKQETQGQEGT